MPVSEIVACAAVVAFAVVMAGVSALTLLLPDWRPRK